MEKDSVTAYDIQERVRRYDADMDVMHPLRGKMIEVALEVLPFAASESLRVLDLGVGTGVFTERLLGKYPGARVVGVDGAAAMLDLARSRLAGMGERVEWVTADFRAMPDEAIEAESYDAVISSYALHHLDAGEKLAVLSTAVRALRPGGWLLNADLVKAADAGVERRIQELRVEGVTSRAAPGDRRFRDAEATRRFLDELEAEEQDRPLTLEEDLRLLREAGFAGAETFWKEHREAVTGGPKGRAS